MKLGISKEQAYMWSYTRRGYWRTAGSPILSRTLTNQYLSELGPFSMLEQYMKNCEDKRTAACETA